MAQYKKEEYLLQVPPLQGFEAEYYFRHDEKVISARKFTPHMHDTLEIYVLLEGDASFVVEHSLYRLEAGDIIITKPNEIHHCVLNSDSTHKHLCFWLDPSCEFLLGEFLRHDFGQGNLISPTPAQKQQLLALYDKLRLVSEKGMERCKFYLILELLDILAQSMEDLPAPSQMPPLLSEILEDIDRNFLSIETLEYFTERFFVSQSTLNRLFRNHLHTTPKLYLETKRLSYSRRLLKAGKSVLAACMESGFPDPSNYIRLFKKRFSVTPGQYREIGDSPENYNMIERRTSCKTRKQ